MTALPPGFVLDQAPAQPAGPPQGYVLDQPGTPTDRSVWGVLTGSDGGPRFQTWPERMVRGLIDSGVSAATLPGDVYAGRQQVDMNDPNFVRRTQDFSALLTPMNPAVRAGDFAIPGAMQAPQQAMKPTVPSAKELKAAGGLDIDAAKKSGLDISPGAVAEYSRKVQQELFDDGIHPVDAPATYAKLKELESAPADAVFTASNLQSLRHTLQETAQRFNPNAASDQLAASRAIKGFDQFLPSLSPKDVLAGAPAPTQSLFERGRGNYAAAQRSNDLTGTLDRARTGILERAEGRAQAANSGRNLDNTIRQRVEGLIEKPKEISGFSDAELQALADIIQGGRVRNAARDLGNLAGGGGGLGQMLTAAIGAGAGATAAGTQGAILGATAPMAIGTVAKALANRLAKNDVRAADELVRMRSPLFQERVANPQMFTPYPSQYDALIRALLSQPQQQK